MTKYPGIMAKVAAQVHPDDYNFSMGFLPGSKDPEAVRAAILKGLKSYKKPLERSDVQRIGGQALAGGVIGGAAGGLARLVGGRRLRGVPTAVAALGALAGGAEAQTRGGKARHAKYHQAELDYWKRTRSSAYRKRLADLVAKDTAAGR